MTFSVNSDCTEITISSDEFASLGPAGAYASTVLTATNVADGEQVELNGKTYTFEEVLTNVDGNVFIEGDVAASDTLIVAGQPGDTETVVVDGKTYTFQAVLTNVDGNVQIGATSSDTTDNLIAAVNLTGTPGTDYAAAMTIHPTVSAAYGVGPNIDFTYKLAGTVGNGTAVSETVSGWSWNNGSFTGGTNNISGTLANLGAAVLLGAGAGTKYAAATTAHSTVTNIAIGPTTATFQSILIGTVGNSYTATETMSNGSFDNNPFAGGVDIPVYESFDLIATDPDGGTTTVEIVDGDLTGGDYVVDDTYFGNSTWAPNMYKFTLDDTAPTPEDAVDEGCVLVDCELQCEVWDKVKDNITSNDCKRTEFHLVYESLINTNGCSTCSCDTALQLYKQLKEDVTNITYNSDCGC